VAVAVCQSFAHVSRLGVPPLGFPAQIPFCELPERDAAGVGYFPRDHEEPGSAVRCSNGGRGEHSPFRVIPEVGQVADDLLESVAGMSSDVFENNESWSALSDDPGDVRPEVARVVLPGATTGDAERLAWITRSDEIHDSTPRASVEGGEVRPDRRAIQQRVLHPGHEDGRSVGVPLDVAHADHSELAQPEVEPADPCAERHGT